MRSPSIHIRKEELVKIFERLEVNIDIDRFMKLCKSKTCNSRGFILDNEKYDKKVKKIISTEQSDVCVFNNLLFMIRKKRKHFGFKKLDENHRDWGLLKEITGLANDFADEFELDRTKAYTEYIEISLDVMSKFTYPKLKSLYELVCQTYHAKNIIQDDQDPKGTENLHNLYVQTIVQHTGMLQRFDKKPIEYQYFVKANEYCRKVKVKPYDYVKAQFKGLEYRNGIPLPIQMVGESAESRLKHYLFQNEKKINLEQRDTTRSEHLKKLKWLK